MMFAADTVEIFTYQNGTFDLHLWGFIVLVILAVLLGRDGKS